MKKVILALSILFVSGKVKAQELAPNGIPIDSTYNKAEQFKTQILSVFPDYVLQSFDTAGKLPVKEYYYLYGNKDGETLQIRIQVKEKFGDKDLKLPFTVCVDQVWVSGQFLSMVKAYNAMLNKQYTPVELKSNTKLQTAYFVNNKGVPVSFYSMGKNSTGDNWSFLLKSKLH